MAVFTHQQIDARILAMIRLCVSKVDADPSLLQKLWDSSTRIADHRIREHWNRLRSLPWSELREMLLAENEAGAELRQTAPFGGFLTNAERLPFYKYPERWQT
jgi:hypothetical protein